MDSLVTLPQLHYERPTAPAQDSMGPSRNQPSLRVFRSRNQYQGRLAPLAVDLSESIPLPASLHTRTGECVPSCYAVVPMCVPLILVVFLISWTIKCRVTQKSGVRTYSNSRGEGKFFNCVFSDESGEIKATAWKNECDAFFDSIELNKVCQFACHWLVAT